MRLGVLDVGSNTVHLLVVDAHWGAHPTPAHSERTMLQLAEQVGPDGVLSAEGEKGLLSCVRRAQRSATEQGCEELLCFVTSAIREAVNGAEVLQRVTAATGVTLQVLSGADEARLTFLAVRRWFGWSAGRLLVLDIGGGSLELATGIDENPDVALSVPLGAGRMTREYLPAARDGGRPDLVALDSLARHADGVLVPAAAELAEAGEPDLVAATSKTFRTLARLTGSAPSGAGLRVPRSLTAVGLDQLVGFVSRIDARALGELQGVSAARAHQIPAGAVVARAAIRAVGATRLAICPWALREGVILDRLDLVERA